MGRRKQRGTVRAPLPLVCRGSPRYTVSLEMLLNDPLSGGVLVYASTTGTLWRPESNLKR